MTLNIKQSYLSVLGLSLCTSTVFAAQVTTDPGDYRPLPAGLNVAALYYQTTDLDELYVDGDRIEGAPTLSTNIGIARWIHYLKIGDFIVDPQVVIPFGRVELNAGDASVSASGVGDPLVGATIWLYNNAETKDSFGVTGFLSIPLGSYDKEQGGINIGENRYKFITQAAYIHQISNDFSLELIGEYTFFGENDEFGNSNTTRKQDAQYGIQTHLNYHMTEATNLSLSYYHDFGAESEIEGVKQDDELDNSRFQITAQHFLKADLQVQLQYGQSVAIENGFYENSFINLRLVKVF